MAKRKTVSNTRQAINYNTYKRTLLTLDAANTFKSLQLVTGYETNPATDIAYSIGKIKFEFAHQAINDAYDNDSSMSVGVSWINHTALPNPNDKGVVSYHSIGSLKDALAITHTMITQSMAEFVDSYDPPLLMHPSSIYFFGYSAAMAGPMKCIITVEYEQVQIQDAETKDFLTLLLRANQ
jgi:hypothetical protein